MLRGYSHSCVTQVLFRHRKVKRDSPLVVQMLRKISVDQADAGLVQAVLNADIMQRSCLHPITQGLHNPVILEREEVNSWPAFIGNLRPVYVTLAVTTQRRSVPRINNVRLYGPFG